VPPLGRSQFWLVPQQSSAPSLALPGAVAGSQLRGDEAPALPEPEHCGAIFLRCDCQVAEIRKDSSAREEACLMRNLLHLLKLINFREPDQVFVIFLSPAGTFAFVGNQLEPCLTESLV
jgi:hypothetical protein